MNQHEKYCVGVGCDLKYRDHCALHQAHLAEHILWFSPIRTGEYCDSFKPRKPEEKEPCDVRT